MKFAAIFLVLAAPLAQASEPWTFESKIAVSAGPSTGVFHHLEGAGRNHIAVSNGRVAAIWEDNRSQEPQVYVAIKNSTQSGFGKALKVSSGEQAYEPSIAALADGRFVLAWEQDATIFVRLLGEDGLAPALRLSPGGASHVSLATVGKGIFASWREQRQRRWFLQVVALKAAGSGELIVESATAVEAGGLETPILFPSLAVNQAGLCVAWEDRRAGHTRLLVSHSTDRAKSFSEPRNLNEYLSNRNQYDQGSGVTRVSLAAFAQDEILAAWMDKRRGGLGYGIFAALGSDGGEIFGPNEKVHGEQGDKQPHYNPATAGNPAGAFVVAWDDFRRGDSDIWLSTYNEDDEWGLDFAPTVASGAGEQSHPAVTLDEQGGLHLLWLERADMDAPSRLWYSHGLPR
ncbi:MAG: hypothetical protein JSU67_18495 [Gammaproteobacteria bacterium]|nr:MAG: hypothetical protein JSU67_18495 [Gammaproteobacteria bacterium]